MHRRVRSQGKPLCSGRLDIGHQGLFWISSFEAKDLCEDPALPSWRSTMSYLAFAQQRGQEMGRFRTHLTTSFESLSKHVSSTPVADNGTKP